MANAFPLEFRRDVVAVARKREASIAQVAEDLGISESCLQGWLKLADIEDGTSPGATRQEAAELRELKKRNRQLASLAVAALRNAIALRAPDAGLIVHSDRPRSGKRSSFRRSRITPT